MSADPKTQYALMELNTPLESALRAKWPRREPRRHNSEDQVFLTFSSEPETPSEFSLESDKGSSDTSDDLSRCV
jgi:hypothetical protein